MFVLDSSVFPSIYKHLSIPILLIVMKLITFRRCHIMEAKPFHYDGSIALNYGEESYENETIAITDEIRVNIGGNPYYPQANE